MAQDGMQERKLSQEQYFPKAGSSPGLTTTASSSTDSCLLLGLALGQ